MVEIDVRFNTKGDVVLCHDRERQNEALETLDDLCKMKRKLHLMIDIKGVGISKSKLLAIRVCKIVHKYPQHEYMLCSFNEYCVTELIEQRELNDIKCAIGVISASTPLGMFHHLPEIEFVSLHCDTIHEEVMDYFRNANIKVYAWVCNSPLVRQHMEHIYKVDGIIYDV